MNEILVESGILEVLKIRARALSYSSILSFTLLIRFPFIPTPLGSFKLFLLGLGLITNFFYSDVPFSNCFAGISDNLTIGYLLYGNFLMRILLPRPSQPIC